MPRSPFGSTRKARKNEYINIDRVTTSRLGWTALQCEIVMFVFTVAVSVGRIIFQWQIIDLLISWRENFFWRASIRVKISMAVYWALLLRIELWCCVYARAQNTDCSAVAVHRSGPREQVTQEVIFTVFWYNLLRSVSALSEISEKFIFHVEEYSVRDIYCWGSCSKETFHGMFRSIVRNNFYNQTGRPE